MFYGTDFLPQVLAIIGGAAALTVLLSLLIAVVPLHRRQRRQPSTMIGTTARDHEALTAQMHQSHL